jgi:hypothetical protein
MEWIDALQRSLGTTFRIHRPTLTQIDYKLINRSLERLWISLCCSRRNVCQNSLPNNIRLL